MTKDMSRNSNVIATNDTIKDNAQTKTLNSLPSNLSFSFKDDP